MVPRRSRRVERAAGAASPGAGRRERLRPTGAAGGRVRQGMLSAHGMVMVLPGGRLVVVPGHAVGMAGGWEAVRCGAWGDTNPLDMTRAGQYKGEG